MGEYKRGVLSDMPVMNGKGRWFQQPRCIHARETEDNFGNDALVGEEKNRVEEPEKRRNFSKDARAESGLTSSSSRANQ